MCMLVDTGFYEKVLSGTRLGEKIILCYRVTRIKFLGQFTENLCQ